MQRWMKRISAIGFLLALAAGNASAAPVEWDYTVSAAFVIGIGDTTFNGAGPSTTNGCEQVTNSSISWGVCPVGPAGTGRSGIGISNNPQSGSLTVNGAAQFANTYTHHNNLVATNHATLASAKIQTTLGMRIKDSGDAYEYQTFIYTIRFSETPNTPPCAVSGGTPCSDIWVLDGSTNRTVVFGGNEFVFSFFPAPAANPLPDDTCIAARVDIGCIGFTTVEGVESAIPFMLNVTHVAAVSGRIYTEGSTPANTEDNGNGVDAGTVVGVSLSCTDPSFSAGPINTGADGSFSFEGVPISANCSVTTTPPAGFQAAYTQQGTTGEDGNPGNLNTSVAGSTTMQTITVNVPPMGSTGNLFALRQVAAVSGRIYTEGSTPANTQDNGNSVDAGTVVGVSLSCTDPSFSAGPINTGADGSFSFEGVPVAANCSVTTTPPTGFQAAYTQQGTTGEDGNPGSLNTSVAGSTTVQTITVSVPPAGSTGNLLALRPVTDLNSATICTPSTAGAGTTVSCTTTCTNIGSSTAFNAFCSIPNAAALPGSPTPVCSAPTNVVSNGVLTCTVSFPMPDSGNIAITGGTGADNDNNGGRDASSGNNLSSASVTRNVVVPPPPAPVPGLGGIALLLLLGLIGLVAFRQYRHQPG
ncbi:THxN family PEP-CTERM protein [Ottowia thiooxydans]|uniref:THxN family PEP-CTERM protein n=1 Tax=Ottowia thiooxydans TaxID=219182 RepID=UPI00040C0410|nr:THxN family PEP-CTERM protein [Ottowia thiooxydans]